MIWLDAFRDMPTNDTSKPIQPLGPFKLDDHGIPGDGAAWLDGPSQIGSRAT